MIFDKRQYTKAIFPVFVARVMILTLLFGFNGYGESTAAETEDHGLILSGMQVKITSKGQTAIFRLYDTVAAKEFYGQLPLTLDLDNFRDAQWMFYPPEKLNVSPGEAYHDGKKGELSYYAPWGDVFMLYKDFYAGDEMHRLGISISGRDAIALMSDRAVIEKKEPQISGDEVMYIQVTSNDNTTVFKLNNSPAAKTLYDQLPMSIDAEDYENKEKIFYPPKKLDTSNTPSTDAKAGTLAYYAPWGDVVMFYKKFGSAAGLYELGQAVSGSEFIQEMTGRIHIEKRTVH